MISTVVRNHIGHIIEDEAARRVFDRRVISLAKSQRTEISHGDLDQLAQMSNRYAFETMSLLETCSVAAANAKLSALVEPVCDVALKVFTALEPDEARETGLFGVL